MNKEQAKERLCAIETEVEKLRRIIDEPEARKPEAGDVYQDRYSPVIILEDSIYRISRGETQDHGNVAFYENETYLGKFDEVFVKISDVRDALNLTWDHCTCSARPNYNKLMDLNIITD